MLELLADPNVWIAFATLTIMEIVLGIDNIVFISVLVSRLPREQAEFARKLGIGLALVFRIVLLFLISWIVQLQDPVFSAFGHDFSWKDIILIAGGGFLIYKATHEMHAAIEDDHEVKPGDAAKATLQAILLQIVVIDMVFSIDSIITAVGMVPADQVAVMVAAVLVAVAVMFVASGPIAKFVADHPTTKMLALAFLLLIGVTLVADGLGFHIPKGYIYSAMAFSVLVEAVNIIAKGRKQRRSGAAGKPQFTPFTGDTGSVSTETALAAMGSAAVGAARTAATAPSVDPVTAAKLRPKSNPSARAQSRPKSAPRKPKAPK
ncbi:Membrane protein TerC, possibly involved in tellurium resistance [Devosia lucknowensis]|uniref:Membrane protein TerC, possibly involved in tellurium resistance n=1 Tax=Devosia lucknowensis TaxID=1096929 RepID=A0A1Y6ERV0_9HYPH|nr:Membrane protein TerC, possibly involved in tellurium resistance [Devosia lucknowensis]